jgi:beta-phosphoglucomutase
MTLKGAIFDLDGVIVDTVPLHFKAWKYLFETLHGIPFTEKDYEDKVDGKPRADSVKLYLPHLSPEAAIAAGETKQQEYLRLLNQDDIVQFASSVQLIEELKQHGVLIAAASSSKNAVYILEKIGLIKDFDVVISGYDFKHGKPHPEIFLNAAAAIKLDVKDCIVFEDALAGVQSAKAGGFVCVGINRHNKPQNYTAADLVVTDLATVHYDKLVNLLQKFQIK